MIDVFRYIMCVEAVETFTDGVNISEEDFEGKLP